MPRATVNITSEGTFEELSSDLVAKEDVHRQQQTSRALFTRNCLLTYANDYNGYTTYRKEYPKNNNEPPVYMGSSVMLKGKPVTRSFIKIPK
jgi:hypothetical protein